MHIPVFFGGGGSGVNKFIYIVFGSLVGAVVGAVFLLVVDAPSKTLPIGVLFGAFDGAIVGWLGWLLDNVKPAVRLGTKDMPRYPRWLLALFPLSLGVLMIGLLSALYIALAGFSTAALAGTYLIPLGLMALYCLLGAAEQRDTQ